MINRAAGKREPRARAFHNLLDRISEVLFLRQPFLPVGGFGEAIDHDVDGAVVEPVDKNQARHTVIADEVRIIVQPAFNLPANVAQLGRTRLINRFCGTSDDQPRPCYAKWQAL